MYQLPVEFEEVMRPEWGDSEWNQFLHALKASPPTSIHYNRNKGQSLLFEGKPILWNPTGQYLPERPSFTLDPHFHAGRYYVQEAGSMFLAYLLQYILKDKHIEYALDMCAAPGGKSTLLLNNLPPNSLLIANEVIPSRFKILRQNIAKWGSPNQIITQADPSHFKPLRNVFDLVLADVPCSGEGLFRKQPASRKEWSLQHVQHCASRQKRILAATWQLVAPGGYLIYATCTYNKEENDQNVDWLIRHGAFRHIHFDVPHSWGITSTKYGFQFTPHKTLSEGFFIALLQYTRTSKQQKKQKAKTRRKASYYRPADKREISILSSWLTADTDWSFWTNPKGIYFALPAIAKSWINRLYSLQRWIPGITMGTIKGKNLIPHHTLALSSSLSPALPTISMNKTQALAFLRKQNIPITEWPALTPGWKLVTYKQYGIGWVKMLPNRMNNYLPIEWCIRMD